MVPSVKQSEPKSAEKVSVVMWGLRVEHFCMKQRNSFLSGSIRVRVRCGYRQLAVERLGVYAAQSTDFKRSANSMDGFPLL